MRKNNFRFYIEWVTEVETESKWMEFSTQLKKKLMRLNLQKIIKSIITKKKALTDRQDLFCGNHNKIF